MLRSKEDLANLEQVFLKEAFDDTCKQINAENAAALKKVNRITAVTYGAVALALGIIIFDIYQKVSANLHTAAMRTEAARVGSPDPLALCHSRLREQISKLPLPLADKTVLSASADGVGCTMTIEPGLFVPKDDKHAR